MTSKVERSKFNQKKKCLHWKTPSHVSIVVCVAKLYGQTNVKTQKWLLYKLQQLGWWREKNSGKNRSMAVEVCTSCFELNHLFCVFYILIAKKIVYQIKIVWQFKVSIEIYDKLGKKRKTLYFTIDWAKNKMYARKHIWNCIKQHLQQFLQRYNYIAVCLIQLKKFAIDV